MVVNMCQNGCHSLPVCSFCVFIPFSYIIRRCDAEGLPEGACEVRLVVEADGHAHVGDGLFALFVEQLSGFLHLHGGDMRLRAVAHERVEATAEGRHAHAHLCGQCCHVDAALVYLLSHDGFHLLLEQGVVGLLSLRLFLLLHFAAVA